MNYELRMVSLLRCHTWLCTCRGRFVIARNAAVSSNYAYVGQPGEHSSPLHFLAAHPRRGVTMKRVEDPAL